MGFVREVPHAIVGMQSTWCEGAEYAYDRSIFDSVDDGRRAFPGGACGPYGTGRTGIAHCRGHVWRAGALPLEWAKQADVAQLVEQLIRNQQVNGSSPFVGSIKLLAQNEFEKPPREHLGGFRA